MKVKKTIAVIVGITVAAGAVAGGIYGYKSYQQGQLVAEVQPVSYINWGYWGDTETSYGMVTNDSTQEIYLNDSKTVKEVLVQEGDTVAVGDPLMEYDTAEVYIEIERKKLDIRTIENKMALVNHELDELRNAKLVVKTPPEIDKNKEAYYELLDEQKNNIPEKDVKDERVYNYITEQSVPSNVKTDSVTGEVIYQYYCNPKTFVYGSFYNSIRATEGQSNGKKVEFLVCKRDANGKILTTPGVDGNGNPVQEPVIDTSINPIIQDGNSIPAAYDSSIMQYVFTGEDYVPSALADQFRADWDSVMAEWKEPEGYTIEELAKAIPEKESELKTLDIQKRQQELQLETLQNTVSDGMVYAEVDGVVKTVGDPEHYQNDGSPFLVVSGDEGLYVSGTISELLLEDVKVGTVVTANSWESGMTFEATITEISDYPANGNSWGDGNPNVSYYAYTAYIEDSSALRNGEYIDLSISTNKSEGGGLYIEKAYVREENGKSYCMIADENDKLKKQYVVTGRTIYGSAVEIKSGLSEEDRIAFPYGKNAVEGAAVEDASGTNMYY